MGEMEEISLPQEKRWNEMSLQIADHKCALILHIPSILSKALKI